MPDPQPKCPWCGSGAHGKLECPRVHSIEFASDGVTIRRVEFIPTAEQLHFLQRCETLLLEVRGLMAEKSDD